MVLVFLTMDSKGQFSPFSCQTPALEKILDVLSGIAATGDLVVSVELLDMNNGQRTALPPKAFDGDPVAPHIRKPNGKRSCTSPPLCNQSISS